MSKEQNLEYKDKALHIADVMRSISLMDKAMKSWHETLKENAEDGKSYSKGLLKGYEGAMNQFQNFLKEYCAQRNGAMSSGD